MSRTLVMAILLAAWPATGVIAGIVMGRRRHDRFPCGCWALRSARCSCRSPLERSTVSRQPVGPHHPERRRTDPFRPRCHRRLAAGSRGADGRARQTRKEGGMTMTVAAAQVELEPSVLDEPALAEDIVDECGLGSFPASDPPSWWATG